MATSTHDFSRGWKEWPDILTTALCFEEGVSLPGVSKYSTINVQVTSAIPHKLFNRPLSSGFSTA